MGENVKAIIEQFVDYLLPELAPYEASAYLYLLRNSFIKAGTSKIRVGKRTIAAECGAGRGKTTITYQTINNILKKLERKGCIQIKNTNQDGTLYFVNLPKDIPLVVEKIASLLSQDTDEDYFNNPEKRREIFERDKWICKYCGEKLAPENTTLDHYIPQSEGGKYNKENLRTCCLMCNSVKSGKTYEKAAPFLLKNIQERKAKSHK